MPHASKRRVRIRRLRCIEINPFKGNDMKRISLVVLFAFFCIAASFTARAEEPKGDKKLPATITPAIKDRNRHDGFVAIAKKGDVDLLFMGDSITDGWRGGG